MSLSHKISVRKMKKVTELCRKLAECRTRKVKTCGVKKRSVEIESLRSVKKLAKCQKFAETLRKVESLQLQSVGSLHSVESACGNAEF